MSVTRSLSNILYRRQKSVLSAAMVIMATVFLSRILGLFRDRLLVEHFPKEELGIYLAAFRLPNLLFELLVIGALSTAFIPVFTSYLAKRHESEAFAVTAYLINIMSLIVLGAGAVLFAFAVPLSRLLAPGFAPDEIAQMAFLTRVILLGQVLPLVVGNFLTGLLQSYQRFIVPAIAPVIYNVGILLSIVLLVPRLGLLAPTVGVVIGAIVFFAIQVPFVLRLGYRHRFALQLRNPGVRRVLHLMLPRTFGLAASQVDATVDLILASFLGPGSVTIFYFAQHLQQFPIGLFGATIAQAALPPLSEANTHKNTGRFEKILLASYHQILFFVLPISMLLVVLRIPAVRLVFGASQFDWPGTILTSQALAYFAISLFAQSLAHLFVRAFYALQDTKTPVVIGIVSVLLNSMLSIVFIRVLDLGVWGLALSTSIASIVNFLALLWFLDRRLGGLDRYGLFIPPLKMVIATLIAGVSLYVPLKLFDQLIFDTTRTLELLLLTIVATGSGLVSYLFFAWFLAIEEVGVFFNMIRKFRRIPRIIFSHADELVDSSEKTVT